MAQDGFIILRRSVPHGPKPLTLRAQKFLPQVLRTLGARLPESARLEPLAIDLTVTTLSDKEVSDLAEDPDVLATAPSIPISLIKPLATEEAAQAEAEQAARAAGISWGVQAVAKDVGPEAGSGTTVAVLDSGIDRDHPAFAGVALTVKNFSSASSENDVFGHGTHCAGTIFGRDVDGVRIGVARGVRRALIGKILDDNGRGNTAAVAQAIQWAYGQGAQVISLSLGIEFSELVQWLENAGRPRSEALSRALSAYRDSVRLFDSTMQLLGAQSAFAGAGSIVVAAAGNSSSRDGAPPIVIDASLPAAANGVVSVGAIGKSNNGYQIAPFSNRNPMLCAPGVGIVSAKRGGGLTALDGTSMAAPHAAGIAVLWWERAREDALPPTSETVRARLLANCTTSSFAASVAISDRGAGLVQSPPPKPSQG